MAWFFSRRPRAQKRRAGRPYPGSHRSPGFELLLGLLERRPSPTILDLGPSSNENLTFLSKLSDALVVQDAFHSSAKGGQRAELFRFASAEAVSLPMLPSQGGHQFDVVLLWDLLHYFPEGERKAFVERLECHLAKDALVFLLASSVAPVPPSPIQFKTLAADRLDYGFDDEFLLDGHGLTTREVETTLVDFRPIRLFQLRNGYQEVVLQWKGEPMPLPEPEPEPDPEPDPEPEPDPDPEPEPDPDPEPEPDPDPEPDPEPKPESEPETDADPGPALETDRLFEGRADHQDPGSATELDEAALIEPESEPELDRRPEPEPEPDLEPEPRPDPAGAPPSEAPVMEAAASPAEAAGDVAGADLGRTPVRPLRTRRTDSGRQLIVFADEEGEPAQGEEPEPAESEVDTRDGASDPSADTSEAGGGDGARASEASARETGEPEADAGSHPGSRKSKKRRKKRRRR